MRNPPQGTVQPIDETDAVPGFYCGDRTHYAGYVTAEQTPGIPKTFLGSTALLPGATLCYQTVKQKVKPYGSGTAFSSAFDSAFR